LFPVNNFQPWRFRRRSCVPVLKLDHMAVWLKRIIERALDLFFPEACDANVRWLGAAKRTAAAAHRQGDRQYSPSIDA
jgi:hypothetical protein